MTPEFFAGLTSFNDTTNAPSRKNAKKAAQLLEGLDTETVKQASEALLALYNWVGITHCAPLTGHEAPTAHHWARRLWRCCRSRAISQVAAGQKLLTEAATLRTALKELAGNAPADLTCDLYLDYENMCTSAGLAPHPHLLPRKQCKKQRLADAGEPDPKAKAPEAGFVSRAPLLALLPPL